MMSLAIRCTRMPAQLAPSDLSGCETCRSSAIMRSSFSSTALNDTSLSAIENVARRAGNLRALHRIDLNQDGIAGFAFPHQRRDRRIARIAAVPIDLAVDLDGLKQRRQAGRSEQHVGRDLAVAEHPAAAGADIGGGHEQLDRRLRQAVEIDAFGQNAAAADWPRAARDCTARTRATSCPSRRTSANSRASSVPAARRAACAGTG